MWPYGVKFVHVCLEGMPVWTEGEEVGAREGRKGQKDCEEKCILHLQTYVNLVNVLVKKLKGPS